MLLSVSTGCDNRPRRVPVSGQVLIDGQPLTTGFVRVVPDNARAATGEIGKDGSFRLTTFDEHDGVVLGQHKVEIVALESQGPTAVKWLTPRKYQDSKTSELTIDVRAPITDWKLELSWDGEQPFVEPTSTEGDAPSMATPAEKPKAR